VPRFNYHAAAESKDIPSSTITFTKDTVVENSRIINFTISPQRKLHKLEFITNNEIRFDSLSVNNAKVNSGNSFEIKRGTFLIYHIANVDKEVTISMAIQNGATPEIIVNEISYDLLSNPLFDIKPRTKEMMAMPFVTNDAIICTQKLKL
jgi:hypothetical protein